MDHRDHFGAMPATDLDLHRLDWQNRLDGVKSGMFKFSPHGDFGGAGNSIESTRAVAKVRCSHIYFSMTKCKVDHRVPEIFNPVGLHPSWAVE